MSVLYDDGFAVFRVSDTGALGGALGNVADALSGVGIPEPDRAKICERFHRVAVSLVGPGGTPTDVSIVGIAQPRGDWNRACADQGLYVQHHADWPLTPT